LKLIVFPDRRTLIVCEKDFKLQRSYPKLCFFCSVRPDIPVPTKEEWGGDTEDWAAEAAPAAVAAPAAAIAAPAAAAFQVKN
jgi:hypothetical protein